MLTKAVEGNIVAVWACGVHNFAIAVLGEGTKVVPMKLPRFLSEHPASVGESYTSHCLHACTFAVRLLAGGLGCLVHAFLPFLFVQTASKCVAQLHAILAARNGVPSTRMQVPRAAKMSRQAQ